MSYSLGQSSYVPPTGGLYDYPTTPGGVPSGGLQDPPPYTPPSPGSQQPSYDQSAYQAGAWARQVTGDWSQYAQQYMPDQGDYAEATAPATSSSSDAAAASIIGVGLLVPLLFFL